MNTVVWNTYKIVDINAIPKELTRAVKNCKAIRVETSIGWMPVSDPKPFVGMNVQILEDSGIPNRCLEALKFRKVFQKSVMCP